MSTINDGGPAFPHEYNGQFPHTGMSLRAGQVMSEVMKQMCEGRIGDHPIAGGGPSGFAATACDLADALIAELGKDNP